MSSIRKFDNIDSSVTFSDTTDSTKQLQFDLSNVSTGTTKLFAIPDGNSDMVGHDLAQTLTNKTIDADLNTITNIDDGDIKSGAGIDASKLHNGSVNNTEFGYLNGVTSGIQTQLDGKVGTGTTLTAGIGISGGGDLSTNRTLNLDIDSLTADGSPDGAADYVVTYDVSAGGHKKVLLDNLPSASGATLGGLTDTVIDSVADNEVLAYNTGTSKWINQTAAEAGLAAASHSHAASDVTSGTFADARISQSSVTQHSTALEGVLNINNLLNAPTAGEIVGNDTVQTITNKTIDADLNSISDIRNGNIASDASIDASKLGDGSVSNAEFGYLDGVTSAIQTQLDTKITSSSSDTLTNKTINADNNTVTNIDNADIKTGAAIDASKIHDGSVSNTEFGYLDGVTSAIQTQLDGKSATGHIHTSAGGWTDNGGDISLSTLTDNVGIGITGATKLLEVRRVAPGVSNHVGLVVSDDPITDDYNLGLDTDDSCLIKMSCEDFMYRCATVFASDGHGTSTILGVSGSSDSGSSWDPKFVVKHDAKVGIGKNNPTQALDVVGSIALTGTVDGRDIATDGSTLDSHVGASTSVHGVSGSVVGNSDSQTLTNKTIDSDNNTITNIADAEIKAGAAIDASKIGGGTVSNTEFGYLDGVTSTLQTQLNAKSATGHTHTASDVTDFDTAADARITGQKGNANGLATLDGSGKVPASQLDLDSVDYQGTWNASTNSPTITDGTGTKGYYYVVSVSGSTNIDGITDWDTGDWIIFNGTVWEKSDHTDQVTSVAGKQGAVTLAASDIASGTFADARISSSSVTQHESSININNLLNAPTGTLVGTSDSQTLTNKTISSSTIDADLNTITNIDNADIKAGAAINAAKIHDGSVSNAEFGYLDGVTSAIQTQLNTKAASSHAHTAGDITSGTFADGRISQSSVTQHEGAINHDSLTGFVADEHTNHSLVYVHSGEGLAGSGNITANVTVSLDVSSLTADATPDGAADYVVTYDASAGGHKKVLLDNLPGGGGGGETNSASNVGSGADIFKQKSGVDLEFRGVNAASSKISASVNGDNIDIDVVPAQIAIGDLSGAPAGEVVGNTDSQTLINKTLNASLNDISNIVDANIASGASIDANKLGGGTVSNTEFGYLNGVTSAIQTQLDTKITSSSSDTLTNKTINADNNTITNIDNADIKAGAAIDAAKIHDGSVSNAEFGYLDGVTSAIQAQLNAKAGSSHSHSTSDLTSGTLGVTRGGTGAATLTDNAILIGAGTGAIEASNWSIDTNDVLSVSTSHAGYVLDIHNTLGTGGGHGFHIHAGELQGDIAFKITDRDGTFNVMEMEADQGYIVTGKTYAQTLTDNGIVHGFDLQHVPGSWPARCDFNTAQGIYRIGGVDVANVAQTLLNKTIDADLNIISDISDGNIASGAAIDAAKIHDGSVSNTEFGYLNGVTSAIQTQLTGKAGTSTTLTAGVGISGGGDLSTNRTFDLDINGLTADATPDGAADYVVTYDASATGHKKVLLNNLPGGGGGETNTASNVGTGGVGIWKQKNGVDLEFKKINSTSATSGITVVDDTGNDEIDVRLDINSLTADASPDGAADYIVTYDASATAHKKVLLNNLPGSSPTFTYHEVSSIVTTSTSSLSYVLINSMTYTPVSGTYHVSFSSSGLPSGHNSECHVAIYSGGSITQHSERLHNAGGAQGKNIQSVHTQAVVTVNGSQAIEARFKSADTYTLYERAMFLLKIA